MKVLLFPTTKWHLYGMYAYLHSVYGDNFYDSLNITVFAILHGGDRLLLNEEDKIYPKVKYYVEDVIKNVKKNIAQCDDLKFNVTDEVVVICPNNLMIRKVKRAINYLGIRKYKLKAVLVDDGIGSYFSKKVWNQCSKSESKFFYIDFLKFYFVKLTNIFYRAKKWNMCGINHNQLIPLHAEDYKKIIFDDFFGKKSNDFGKKIFFKKNNKPIALFVTQPWSELNQLTADEEKNIITKYINALGHKYDIYLKMHPREEKNKYMGFFGAKIIDSDIPVEMFFLELSKDDLVVGFNSTAMVNAAFIFQLKVLSMIHDLDFSKKNMITQGCKEFLDLTRGFISTDITKI